MLVTFRHGSDEHGSDERSRDERRPSRCGAKTLYSKLLGIEPYTDEPYYVGFRVGDQGIGLDTSGHNKGMTGPVGYWHVDDIKESLQVLLDADAQVQQDVTDIGWGKLIASVKDTDGNTIGLIQAP